MYTKNTIDLLEQLPSYFMARYDYQSTMGRFLTSFGQRLDSLEKALGDFRNSFSLDNMDLSQPWLVYKGLLPYESFNCKFKVKLPEDILMNKVDFLEDFLRVKVPGGYLTEELHFPYPYWVDQETHAIYTRQPVKKITLLIYTNERDTESTNERDMESTSATEHEVTMYPHQIWTDFDEYGFLLNLPRLEGEDNVKYKHRLMDAERYMGESNKTALTFFLHRSLGLVFYQKWNDPSNSPIRFQNTPIVPESVRVNSNLASHLVEQDDDGYFMAPDSSLPENSIVSYYAGVQIKDIQDFSIPEIMKIRDKVHHESPLTWDERKLGFGYWPHENTIKGLGYIPVHYDME